MENYNNYSKNNRELKEEPEKVREGFVKCSRLKLRRDSVIDDNVITILPESTKVIIHGEKGEWLEVEVFVDKETTYNGYVMKSYIKE